MILSRMYAADKYALTCDLAEYYHVFNIDDLPLEKVAILACGLPPQSRIIKKLTGHAHDLQTLMTASILDYLAILVWFQTKDGHKHRNRPKSYVKILTDKPDEQKEKRFASASSFEEERKRILQGIKRG